MGCPQEGAPACPFPQCPSSGQEALPPDLTVAPLLTLRLLWGRQSRPQHPRPNPFSFRPPQPGYPLSPGVSGIPTALGPSGEGWSHGWRDAVALLRGIRSVTAHLWASDGPKDPLRVCFSKSHPPQDVWLIGCCVRACPGTVVWGLVCLACSQMSVCCPPARKPLPPSSPCVPRGWSRALARARCFPSPFSLALPFTAHCVHPMCLWVDARSCHALSRVYMMCSMHSPCPTPSLPRRGQDGWPPAPPSPTRPTLPCCATVCVEVHFCVAGVSRDVAVFADMSPPAPSGFSVGS